MHYSFNSVLFFDAMDVFIVKISMVAVVDELCECLILLLKLLFVWNSCYLMASEPL